MTQEFRMPTLGPDMESGTLVEWRIKPGDSVRRGDVVALVETEKGVIDVEIFANGTVEKLLVEPGAKVPVGTALAQLSGEPATAAEAPTPPKPQAAPVTERAKPEAAPAPAPGAAHRLRISPAARARAQALGIDPAQLVGTGPGGAITLEDIVRQAVPAAPAAPTEKAPAEKAPPATGMREAIARAMSRSKREIPHYYLTMSCNFGNARRWIEQHNASVSVEQRLLPAALFLKAVANAAHAMPDFNGFHDDTAFTASADIHVGMAIAMRGGRLVAPAILHADTKTLDTVMQELRDLTSRVRAGRMRGSELALPTITVTSLGEEGIDTVMPVIYPPQVAMVGFGSVLDRPWAVDGTVKVVPIMTISLAADHRVTDGRAGARFLALIRDALQHPESL